MGTGGRMSIPPPTNQQDVVRWVPYEKPTPFTVGQLKKATPDPHCFNRSILRSFSYVVYDLAIVTLVYLFASSVIPQLPTSLCLLAWPMYWVVQGCVLMGIWVVAHECSHHAFRHQTWFNDTVGLVLHSSLLVPYLSWKYSHRRHHSNTGSLERDEAFVLKQKSQVPWFSKYLNNPPGRLLSLTVILTLGWPLYLAFNISGRKYVRFTCHYDPYGPIYNDRERAQIFISDVGVPLAPSLLIHLIVVPLAPSLLIHLIVARGIAWVACVYGVPLLIVNGFLVVITYLQQHTHASLSHYDSSEWDSPQQNGAITTPTDHGACLPVDLGHLCLWVFFSLGDRLKFPLFRIFFSLQKRHKLPFFGCKSAVHIWRTNPGPCSNCSLPYGL